MKILQLIQKKQLRGAEVFAAHLSAHMAETGHDVLLVSLYDGNAQLPFTGKIASLDALQKNKFYDFRAWKRLADIIRDFKPDIVQANAGDTLKYAVISKKIFRWRQPLIFRNASMVSRYTNNRFSKVLNSFLLKNASHIISVSDYTKNDLVKHFGISSDRITTLPVGIEANEIKKINSFDNNFVNLVHVGGFSFEKNHERLLPMFKELFLKDKRFRLWLIGDGPLLDKIKKLAAELEINEYVFFMGFIENPLDFIYSSDILLLPSIIEGLPAVILEAFYCKTPVVAYNVGGIASLVKNEETGWLTEMGNEDKFVENVIKIRNTAKETIGKITVNAYEMVMAHYFNRQIAASFIQVYQHQSKKG